MKPTHIEHLGMAVTSLEATMPFFELLTGSKCYSIEEVADQKVMSISILPFCLRSRGFMPGNRLWTTG